MSLSRREILEELARRKMAATEALDVVGDIRTELYGDQLAIIDDPARNKGILGTRRSGKTNTWHRYCPIVALTRSKAIIRVWSSSRLRCKELMWNDLKDVCARHHIPVVCHETELRITFENGSEIRLVGADRDKDAQKKRGDKTTLEIVLEAQSFGYFLRSLVEDVIEPSLFDTLGTVCVEGTPGIVEAGFWYNVSGRNDTADRWESVGDQDGVGVGWSMHRLTVLRNPFLPHAAEELAAIKKKKRWADDNPTYVREWCARWVNDVGARYYRWTERKNVYSSLETKPFGPGWSHVLGWDIGYNDAMAIVVWGWHEHDATLYEAASWSESPKEWGDKRVISDEIVRKIREFQSRFNIVDMVADTGGGGRLFVEEVQSRHGLVFKPAQKTDKYAHVVLMNDDFLTGRIKTIAGSAYTEDVSKLPVDPNWEPESGKPPGEDPTFPNHTTDAGLYSWRYASAFLSEKATPEKNEAEKAEEQMLESVTHKDEPWWEPEQGVEDEFDDGFRWGEGDL